MTKTTGTTHPFVKRITEAKKKTVASKKGRVSLNELKSRIADSPPTRSFQEAITRPNGAPPMLIAEIKKASPSKGILCERFDPIAIAKIYERGGASAISVLTEEEFFLGRLSYLADVKSAVSLPILQKDFILDEFQIYEARVMGADAILLIVALLAPQQVRDYLHLASDLEMAALVEVHTESELEGVIDFASVIGINNRDLSTFKTDIQTTVRLMNRIPSAIRQGKCFVGESGIGAREDVLLLAETGIDALLIGETFMVSESIEEKMKALFVARPLRGHGSRWSP